MGKENIELIRYELKVDGFSVLEPSCHDFNGLDSIAQRFRAPSLQQELNNPYKAMIFKEADLDNRKNSDLKHYHRYCNEIISQLETSQNQLGEIYQTLDTPDSKHIAQDPHFDRFPTLKFMLYANDLTTESGAFCLSPGSHIWTKENFGAPNKRPSHGSKGWLNTTRSIPDPILNRIKAIEGAAGTIIIFDTDCIHHQGVVNANQANIIRAHYWVKSKNSTIRNFLKRFTAKISSRAIL